MSEENVEVVRALYASFELLPEGGEVDSWVHRYFDPDCQYQPVEEISPVCGHDAVIAWVERWLEAWSSATNQIEEIIDDGEIVVAAVRIRNSGRTSGIETDQRLFYVFEMREGRIRRMREFLDREPALEAAGLSG